MRACTVSLTAVVLALASAASAQAQSAQDQAEHPAAATVAPAATAPAASADADLALASRYKTAGAVLTVFGALGAAMGTGMVIGRDDDPEDDSGGIPIEVGVAAAGVVTLFAGVYLSARGRSLEARAKDAAVVPVAFPGGLGVGVLGRF